MNISTLPDIPRFYTALAEWLACVLFLIPLRSRYSRKKTVLIAAAALLIQSVFLVMTGNVPIFFWIPCMAAAVLMMILFLYTCAQISLIDAAYYGMIAFVTAEFLASVEWQMVCYFWNGRTPVPWIQAVFLAGTYGVLGALIGRLLLGHLPREGSMNITKKEYMSGFLIAVSVFAVSNLSFLTENTPFSGHMSFEIGNIRTLVDLGGIATLYAHLVQCCEIRIRRELESVQSVLQNQYVQYKQSRESIELINYKYHDLKHQIAFLRSENDPQKREEFLNRMEEEIRQYEAQNKTGNSVLDTVLTTKSLYCAKHGITFTCVADGALLSFMDVMDICSIFGNALDNAIECELKIPEREKRLIHVTVTKQKAFLLLCFENYYEDDLQYQEGSLVTTKKEKQYHGYGLKSIKYTVDKYDGAVSIDTRENWFNLKILIPMQQTQQGTV